MSRSDYRTLIDRGRKAGLNTSELYSAMNTRRPSAQDMTEGSRDSNGFAAGFTPDGHQVYRPEFGSRQ